MPPTSTNNILSPAPRLEGKPVLVASPTESEASTTGVAAGIGPSEAENHRPGMDRRTSFL